MIFKHRKSQLVIKMLKYKMSKHVKRVQHKRIRKKTHQTLRPLDRSVVMDPTAFLAFTRQHLYLNMRNFKQSLKCCQNTLRLRIFYKLHVVMLWNNFNCTTIILTQKYSLNLQHDVLTVMGNVPSHNMTNDCSSISDLYV